MQQQYTCQFCGAQGIDHTVCGCAMRQAQATVPPSQYGQSQCQQTQYQQPYTSYPPVHVKAKRPPGIIMIKVASIINIALAGFGAVATAPSHAGVPAAQVIEFVVLALILGMSIASLVMAKDKSKAGLILAFGIASLVLVTVSMAVIPEEPLFILFSAQGILHIVGALKRKSAQI